MNDYLLGCDVLGAESTIKVTDVTPPSVTYTSSSPSAPAYAPAPVSSPMYGPGSSSGTYYTDRTTIAAVQKKLQSLGYFNGTVDGVYGPVTNAAIRNYSGKDGPPDDALLAQLGLRGEVAFDDAEVDSMVVQAKTASTPVQVQLVAAKVEKLAASAPPEVRSQIAAAKNDAARAVTPAQAQAAGAKLAAATAQLKKGMPAWKLALIISGSVAGVLLLLGGVSLLTRPRTAKAG